MSIHALSLFAFLYWEQLGGFALAIRGLEHFLAGSNVGYLPSISMPHRDVILCVDDDELTLGSLVRLLAPRFEGQCEVISVCGGAGMSEVLDDLSAQGKQVAVLLIESTLAGFELGDLLAACEERNPHVCKVLVTSQLPSDPEPLINRMRVNYYVGKPWKADKLMLVVESMLRQYRLASENTELIERLTIKNRALQTLNVELEAKVSSRTKELADANQRLAHLAVTDGLTGLYNRRHFQEALELEVERSSRTSLPVSLIMLDVDHFKKYNDRNGHPAGDQVLREIAQLLERSRRVNDFCARYGGEEFAVILVDTGRDTAVQVAERIRKEVEVFSFSHETEQPGGGITISLGVATCPDNGKDVAVLIKAADDALYQAKEKGRNRVEQATTVL